MTGGEGVPARAFSLRARRPQLQRSSTAISDEARAKHHEFAKALTLYIFSAISLALDDSATMLKAAGFTFAQAHMPMDAARAATSSESFQRASTTALTTTGGLTAAEPSKYARP